MSRCGFPTSIIEDMQVFYAPQSQITLLELGRIQLLSLHKHGHVEIAAEEFDHQRYHYSKEIRGLQGDPIRRVFYEVTSIQRLYDWGGRKLIWHLVENVWSAPSRDTTSRFRYFEFRLEPIPEV